MMLPILTPELTLVLQSTLLLLTAFVLTAALRRASAALRHHVWTLAFALLLLLPWWPKSGLQVVVPLPSTVTRIVVTAESPAQSGWTFVEGAVAGGVTAVRWMWLAGVLVLAGRIVAGHARAHRIAARAGEWLTSVNGRPQLLHTTEEVEVPMVVGLFAPRILLPEAAKAWPMKRLSAVLAHERMHLQRFDLWWQLLTRAAVALYWPNPLVWLAARNHHRDCEQACDDGVLHSGVVPSDYAQHVMEIARGLVKPQSQPEGGLAMAKTTSLEARLRAILNPLTSHQPIRPRTALLTSGLALVLMAPLAGLQLIAQPSGVSMRGVVEDASGARIPEASVTLLFPKDPSRREIVRTNDAGEFQFPALPSGNYALRIERPGFARLEQGEVAIEAGKLSQFKFVLNVGMIREGVQVRGEAPSGMARPNGGSAMNSNMNAGVNGPSRIRVGGNVAAANLVTKVSPIYPPDCKAEGVQGTVVLNAVIGADGSVLNVEPSNQFVDERLRRVAMDAVRQWRYKPTLLNGNPIEVLTQIDVNFTLLK